MTLEKMWGHVIYPPGIWPEECATPCLCWGVGQSLWCGWPRLHLSKTTMSLDRALRLVSLRSVSSVSYDGQEGRNFCGVQLLIFEYSSSVAIIGGIRITALAMIHSTWLVQFAFCSTLMVQNMKITWKTPSYLCLYCIGHMKRISAGVDFSHGWLPVLGPDLSTSWNVFSRLVLWEVHVS